MLKLFIKNRFRPVVSKSASTSEGPMLVPHRPNGSFSGSSYELFEQDDTQLVKGSCYGDQAAFGILVQRHQRRIFNLVFRMLQNEEDATKVTLEVFVAAWQQLPALRDKSRFATWLYRLAYHCCMQQLELREREGSLPATIGAEAILARSDRQALLHAQIEQLPTIDRMVLILRHVQMLNYEEMNIVLNLPVRTIKAHLYRARNLLKERLNVQHS